MNVRKFYIHFLVIAAIVLSSISPACAFISGKGFIEICAPDGSLQRIEVDAAFDPFAEPVPLSEHLEAMEQCAFCFASSHHVADIVQPLQIVPSLNTRYLFISGGSAIPLTAELSLYQPRGPPTFS